MVSAGLQVGLHASYNESFETNTRATPRTVVMVYLFVTLLHLEFSALPVKGFIPSSCSKLAIEILEKVHKMFKVNFQCFCC